jgi:rhodanese-related sulfurtransferase
MRRAAGLLLLAALASLGATAAAAPGPERPDVRHAVLAEADPKTPEISTSELERILSEGSATVFDSRPFLEFAVGHIPGARNLSAKPGVSRSLYVSDAAEVGRVVRGDRKAAIVLYCNGPFCGKSKRLAEELLEAGYSNVRRYQLGIPVWRALGGVTEIEPEGLAYVLGADATAVVIDAPGARRVPGRDDRPRAKPAPERSARRKGRRGGQAGEGRRPAADGRSQHAPDRRRVERRGGTPRRPGARP